LSEKVLNKRFNADPPAEMNWVTQGAVTPVKTEGSCSSGYAMGAIEPFESAHFLLYKQLLVFSVQQIIDCSSPFGNKGCNVN
jgi:C1A family cysteine protease